jgi:hypothetical protein
MKVATLGDAVVLGRHLNVDTLTVWMAITGMMYSTFSELEEAVRNSLPNVPNTAR